MKLAIPFIGVAVFIGFMWVFSRLSGWAQLAEHYRAPGRLRGSSSYFASGKVGRIWYRSSLIVTTNPQGLGLRNVPPLGLFEGALLIPWAELSAHVHPGWFGGVTFRPRATPRVEIWLWPRLGKKVAAVGGLLSKRRSRK